MAHLTSINGSYQWGTTTTTTAGTGGLYTITSPKVKYIILGEEYETDGNTTFEIANMIAILNVLGKPYWIELKKQNVSFGNDMENFIEERFLVLERDRKITEIIDIITDKNEFDF